jgi:hypothetical protein
MGSNGNEEAAGGWILEDHTSLLTPHSSLLTHHPSLLCLNKYIYREDLEKLI